MTKPYAMGLTVLAVLLGGGAAPCTEAQETYPVPPAYGASPQLPESSPIEGAQPRYQAPAPTDEAPSSSEYGEGGWLPSGGSLRVETTQGIRHVSGGIGLSGRDELRALSDQFNLRLMFALHGSGNYLADVEVRILDSGGAPVLSATSEGPYFLAQLPPGRYTVEARMFGQSQQQTVRVGGGQAQLNFYWR